jgi:DnaK suppressor protein
VQPGEPVLSGAERPLDRADPIDEHFERAKSSCLDAGGLAGLPCTGRAVKLIRVGGLDIPSLLEAVEAEQERTARQIASLEAVVSAIIDGSELISTDDEHDPEGATIAYERAQAIALLRQARADRDALVVTRRQLEQGRGVVCAVCGRDIDLERVAALPTTSRCVRCAA